MISRVFRRVLPWLLMLVTVLALAGDEKIRLAVMGVEDQSGLFKPKALEAATDLLRGLLTKSEKFIVIDKGQQEKELRKMYAAQKKETYKECYDQSCQIELGQALSADTLLRTKISQLGKVCALNSEMIDLAKEAGVRSGVSEFNCTEDGLLGAIKDVVAQLTGVSAGAAATEPAKKEEEKEDKYSKLAQKAEAEKRVYTRDLGIEWVSIPGGTYEMGCSEGDTECANDETPRHTVTVRGFRMMKYEVTQGQYRKVMGENPSYFKDCGETCPVEQVDWNQAKAFCEKIGGRLPTEEEWEYAARAGTKTKYYCGNDSGCLDAIAWYDANSGETTHPVGQKRPNAFGLYDMTGNVWEWTGSCYSGDYNSGQDCSRRVFRGGSWDYYARGERSSDRFRGGPTNRHGIMGLRCGRD